MTTLYRICKTKRVGAAFDGEGARLYGGRWNSPGTRMVYTAGSLSLAVLEILVHLENDAILPGYSYVKVDCPDDLITNVIDIAPLPKDWQSSPPPGELKQIGDEWTSKMKSAVLAVPSAVVSIEPNYLINPAHSDFGQLKFSLPEALTIDPRLFE